MLKSWGLLCLLAASAWAQTWEVGALGAYGVSRDLKVTSPAGAANAGFRNGVGVGFFAGDDTYRYWGGEARYIYRFSDLQVSSGSTKVSFGGHTHIVEANFLAHFRPREKRIRPFFAFGGGIKIFQGTGIERAAQPLGRFVALTATKEWLPVAGVGVGVKVDIRRHLRFRLEGRDYISGTPDKVLAPVPGAVIGGVLHDFLGMAALSYTF